MEKKFELNEPLNAEERYLYGINVRLSILIEQISSLLEHISKKDEVAIEKSVKKLETVIDKTDDVIEVVQKAERKPKAKKTSK